MAKERTDHDNAGTAARFRDLDTEAVKRLIHPERVQISLKDMSRDLAMRDLLAKPVAAVGVTVDSRAITGHLAYENDEFVFKWRQANRPIRNNQLLVITFNCKLGNYYVQATTASVYNLHCVLAPVQPRFYKRIPVKSPATIWTMPPALIKQLAAGKQVIRRHFQTIDQDSGVHYFIRDLWRDQNLELWVQQREDWRLCSGEVLDLSMGGCSALVPEAKSWKVGDIAYIQTTLAIGKVVGNVDAFAIVRRISRHGERGQLHCAFLDILPAAFNRVAGMTREFLLYFGDQVHAFVDGDEYEVTTTLRLNLCLGVHSVRVIWPDGAVTNETFTLGPTAKNYVNLKRGRRSLDDELEAG